VAILISAHELSKTYASRTLFEGITFSIESGERIGLIGPNGAGKSTLLRILAGEIQPDEGKISIQRGLRIGYLPQVPPFTKGGTIQSSVLEGARDPGDWQTISKAQELMSKLNLSGEQGLTPEVLIENLSGGWKKRVALARELLKEPDLLLLDEPTNHLDVESILWLEEFLSKANFATLTITHDRVFLQRVSNRILELDRRHKNGLLSVVGDYAAYLDVRQQMLAAQESTELKLRNTLRRETEWLRRGAQARTTKQQARIHRAESLRDEVEDLTARNQVATAKLDFRSFEKNPKKLIEAKGITKSYDGKTVIPPLDLLISPTTRLGLIGANGCGKSTLIRLLVGQEKVDRGTVHHSDRLQVSYFEQNRETLDPNENVLRTICPDGDFVNFAGTPVHAKSYLSRFLFDYHQMDLPVGRLSGGEQARLLLAKMMLRPANVLVLDEPTNDLDMATLDVLREVLDEFQGAILLVSHDRYFLDQVCTQLLAFGTNEKGDKELVLFSDLAQWESWHDEQQKIKKKKASEISSAASRSSGNRRKLSYKDQRELDGMEERILAAEKKLSALTDESARPEIVSNATRLMELTQEMSSLQTEIDRLYARWAELTREEE
jgi:ATP-binding cassette subfamily F protein uup